MKKYLYIILPLIFAPLITVGSIYQVKQGDTIKSIANQFEISNSDIFGFRSGNPDLIYPGETLEVNSNLKLGGEPMLGGPTATYVQNLRITALPNENCIGTDADGDVQTGTCGGGGGGDSYWVKSGSFLYTSSTAGITRVGILTISPSSTLHVVGTLRVTASSTFNDNINASGTLAVAGDVQHQSTTYLIGSVRASSTLEVSGQSTLSSIQMGGDIINEFCGTGIVCTSNTIATTLGTSVGPTELASSDFGDFTCNGTVCTLDATYLTGNQTITLSGDVSGSGATSITTTIGNDKILESMLKAVDAPNDEECLSYEATVGDFEWQACGTGGGGSSTDWVGSGTTLTASSSYNLVQIFGTASSTDLRTPSSTLGTINGTINFTGAVNSSSTFTNSAATVLGSTLHAGGAVDFSSTLGVTGLSTLAGVNASGVVNASSSLNVSGATMLQSTTFAIGAVRASSTLEVTGASWLNGNLTAGGTLQANGAGSFLSTLAVASTLNASSALNVSGATMLQSSAYVIGALRASSTLEVTGHAQFGNVSSTNEYVNGTLLIPTTGTLFSGMIKNNTASGTLAFHDGTAQRSLTDGDCTLSYSFGTNGRQSGVVLVSPHATFATSTAVNVYAVNGGNPSNSDTMSFNIFLTNNRATATSSLRSLFTAYQTVTATTTADSLSVNGSTTIRSSDMMLIDLQPASTTDASIVVCKRVD